ncbi:hypothetical protein [Merismopedia glauca]|uniref:hypothetical protein n=1 Tax=Merismopedia glauca TaxID=292586 RepID=UPI0015E6EB55|nr:hypothetical protein [Merismopedia glauca]
MNFSKNHSAKSSKSSEPLPPAPAKEETSDVTTTNLSSDAEQSTVTEPLTSDRPTDSTRGLPIPPAGEIMQYRAIGLVKGRYIPSLEQFTQGTLISEDNTLIDTVLLGRVMSLIKKHIDLSQNHLWVVYPRVGKEDNKLHLQIVGIWEPKTLKPKDNETEEPEAETEAESPKDGYFSIRGDVIYQSTEDPHLIVKIKQAARKQGEKPKFFKLKLQGSLADRMVGHFWELNVQRQGETLVIESGTDIGELPKGKPIRKKFPPRKGARPETSRPVGQKPIISKPVKDNKANTETHPPNLFRKPIPKPSKRQPPSS